MKFFKKNNEKNQSNKLPESIIEAMRNAPENATAISCDFIFSDWDTYNNIILKHYLDADGKLLGRIKYQLAYVSTATKNKYFDTTSHWDGRFYFRDFMEILDDYEEEATISEDDKENESDNTEITNNAKDKANDKVNNDNNVEEHNNIKDNNVAAEDIMKEKVASDKEDSFKSEPIVVKENSNEVPTTSKNNNNTPAFGQ